MLKIRLSRLGCKKQPFFSIIVIDSRKSRNSKYIEKIGFYNPILKNKKINKKKINYWKNRGAFINKSLKKIIK